MVLFGNRNAEATTPQGLHETATRCWVVGLITYTLYKLLHYPYEFHSGSCCFETGRYFLSDEKYTPALRYQYSTN